MRPFRFIAATLLLAWSVSWWTCQLKASQASIQWHLSPDRSPAVQFSLAPPNPTATNLIHFIAPTDGQVYLNGCFASVTNGNPSISVDQTNRIIRVTFSPPLTNLVCPLFVQPVSGIEGDLAPLRSGSWTFETWQNSYMFTVAGTPLGLTIQPLSNDSSFRLSWPVSGDLFLLESADGLIPGAWQPITNPPAIEGNQYVVQIDSTTGARFFRLRRTP